MYTFRYHRARSVDDALSLLAVAEDPVLLAGGQTLLPTMKLRLAAPSDVIDLNGVGGLDEIGRDARHVSIGALTRHAQVAASEVVQAGIPALAALAGHIGDPQVRNRGTLGGSVAHADPAADYPAAVLGLGAAVHTNRREIPADEFFKGLFETALEEGEIVTRVVFPVPVRAAYCKFPNPASRYAIVGVFVAQAADGVRVAVTGAGDQVFRVPAMESALGSSFTAEAGNENQRLPGWTEQRHPRQRRVPSSSDHGHGLPSGFGRRWNARSLPRLNGSPALRR